MQVDGAAQHQPERAVRGGRERRDPRGIQVRRPPRRVQPVVGAQHRAEPRDGGVGRRCDRRGEVAGTVGREVVEVACRRREDDAAALRRRPGQQIGEVRRLGEGVGAVGDHDSVEPVVEDRGPHPPGQREHGGRRDVPARLGGHVHPHHVGGYQVGRQRRDQVGR
jgi:hypothetical protein